MVSIQIENFNHQLLKILTRTWSRDSHGLFDYEATSTKNNIIFLQGRTKLIRKKNEVKHSAENSELDLDERELGKIKFENNIYYLSSPVSYNMQATEQNINDLQNKIWYVIKQEEVVNPLANTPINICTSSCMNEVYDLKINDIIKLGRVKYAITEINLYGILESIDKDFTSKNSVFNLISEYKKTSLHPDLICKICLSNHEEDSNPMVNLCKCSGSISSVHFLCLKSWMQTKLMTKENEKKTVMLYSMKSFNCEICKSPYPLRFRSENSFFDIIDYARPINKNYIILESLNQFKENNNYKSIQVITLEENEKIIMGRGHETDVRINDISVSRTHASITLSCGKIYIRDLKSKFGTLVLIQNEIEISEKTISLQIGRTYAEFSAINQKEYQKIKKELSLAVKIDDKGPALPNFKNKLFQVEKGDPGNENKCNKPNNLNRMDIDLMHNLAQGYLFANSVMNNLNTLTNNNSNQNNNNNLNLNSVNLSLMNINSNSNLKDENIDKDKNS